jgi:hypothetical protein
MAQNVYKIELETMRGALITQWKARVAIQLKPEAGWGQHDAVRNTLKPKSFQKHI